MGKSHRLSFVTPPSDYSKRRRDILARYIRVILPAPDKVCLPTSFSSPTDHSRDNHPQKKTGDSPATFPSIEPVSPTVALCSRRIILGATENQPQNGYTSPRLFALLDRSPKGRRTSPARQNHATLRPLTRSFSPRVLTPNGSFWGQRKKYPQISCPLLLTDHSRGDGTSCDTNTRTTPTSYIQTALLRPRRIIPGTTEHLPIGGHKTTQHLYTTETASPTAPL